MLSLAVILKKAWPYIAGAALLVGAYLYVDSQGYHRAELKKNVEIADIKAASAKAELEAWKQKDKQEKKYAEQAQKADDRLIDISGKYNAALLRYASSSAGKARPSSSPNTSSGSDGPGDGPKLPYELVISFEDAQICTDNTARLQTVREWGLSILKDQSSLADQSKDSERPPTPTETNSSGSSQ